MISTIFPFLSSQVYDHPLRSLVLLFLGVPLTYFLLNEYARSSVRIKGFSGPRNWPLVGNIPDIRVNAAEKYRQWARTYGDVYQIQLGNVPVLVVNSADSARKIFGQHSQALSSRPVFWTFHKVCWAVGIKLRHREALYGKLLTVDRCSPIQQEPQSAHPPSMSH
jgi:3-hydroxyphenylacetate 6-hydroxylase